MSPFTLPDHDRSWEPVLDEDWITPATDAIDAIVTALPRADEPSVSPSLVGGQTGIALLFGYLALARSDEPCFLDATLDHLETAMDKLAAHRPFAALYSGFPGIAWTIEHFAGRLLEAHADDEALPVLLHVLQRDRWRGPVDLTNGLVGLGVCALEALPKQVAADVLEQVVLRLQDAATRTAEHVSWRTSPSHLPRAARRRYPDGRFNLGVAHGTPGVIALLGRAVEVGVAADVARDLLEGAVPWLLAQTLPSSHSIFPSMLDAQGRADGPARLAWCYGDLGIAVALFGMARRVGRDDWCDSALHIARKAAERSPDTAGVRDAGVCHGAAGLGHLFNRLYQATDEPALAEAARFWFRKTLAYRDTTGGVGVGGFWALDVGEGSATRRVAAPGFLNGATGIALTLLAATTEVAPDWDRILLASLPSGSTPI